MSAPNSYLTHCQNSTSLNDLAIKTFQFIEDNFGSIPLTLLRHSPCPGNLEIVKTNTRISLESWIQLFKNIDKQSYSTSVIYSGENVYCFSSLIFSSDIIYTFIIPKDQYEKIEEIIQDWHTLNHICKNSKDIALNETKNKYSNLISQLMHDVQSLIELNPKKNDEQLLKRIDYQKSLNKNLLFYIRDFDLYKSEIEIVKLVTDSLKLLSLNVDDISMEILNPYTTISVDVELFSKAFNAIVQNAAEATQSDFSKIQIRIFPVDSISPFSSTNWIAFEVIDSGSGISKDFLPYIKNPFFTTKKYYGCSGFGLTNAEKIINAHRGIIKIETGSNTKITMLIPEN